MVVLLLIKIPKQILSDTLNLYVNVQEQVKRIQQIVHHIFILKDKVLLNHLKDLAGITIPI